MSNQHEQDIIAMQASLEATCGPAAVYSDHKAGETITYHMGGEIRTGLIVYIVPPTTVMSQHIPLTYLIDSGHGWPDYAYQSDIVERELSD